MESLQGFLDFSVNPKRHWTTKSYVVLAIISFIAFFELGTGIISGFVNGQRIDQLAKIGAALATPGLDKESVMYLKAAKADLIKRGTVPSYSLGDFGTSFASLIERARYSMSPKTNPASDNNPTKNSIYSSKDVYTQIFSSSFVWMLMGLLHTIGIFVVGDYSLNAIGRWITILFIYIIMIVGSTVVFAFLPTGDGSFRVLVNILLQMWLFLSQGVPLENNGKPEGSDVQKPKA